MLLIRLKFQVSKIVCYMHYPLRSNNPNMVIHYSGIGKTRKLSEFAKIGPDVHI
jgi:DNA transposition AAA+ family ATPase